MPDNILISQQSNDDELILWDIEAMIHASEGIGKDDVSFLCYIWAPITCVR
jgi:hypothetical protein